MFLLVTTNMARNVLRSFSKHSCWHRHGGKTSCQQLSRFWGPGKNKKKKNKTWNVPALLEDIQLCHTYECHRTESSWGRPFGSLVICTGVVTSLVTCGKTVLTMAQQPVLPSICWSWPNLTFKMCLTSILTKANSRYLAISICMLLLPNTE